MRFKWNPVASARAELDHALDLAADLYVGMAPVGWTRVPFLDAFVMASSVKGLRWRLELFQAWSSPAREYPRRVALSLVHCDDDGFVCFVMDPGDVRSLEGMRWCECIPGKPGDVCPVVVMDTGIENEVCRKMYDLMVDRGCVERW